MKKLWLITFVVLLLSCQDEVVTDGDCLILPDNSHVMWPGSTTYPSEGQTVFWAEYAGPFVHSPCFNPNNSNEFIYHAGNGVHKHNLVTKEDVIIYGGPMWSRAYWGKGDLMTFSLEYQIYTIKSDGTDLNQLTFSGYNHEPSWDYSGTKIIYSTGIGSLNSSIISAAGTILYTIPDVFYFLDWSMEPNKILYTQNGAFYESDSLFQDRTKIFDNMPFSGLIDIAWLNEQEILWSANGNIYIANPTNQENNLFKQGCFGYSYETFSVSPDKQKIITTVQRLQFEEPDRLLIYRELHIMNTDGSGEQVIPLPQ